MVDRPSSLLLAIALTSSLASCALFGSDGSSTSRLIDSLGWVACSPRFVPLSDTKAAGLVVPALELRPANAAPNGYQPSLAELATYLTGERDTNGFLPTSLNPYAVYVTGAFTGTTDEIIQWGANKWGIPADWLRAQYVIESNWSQAAMGDLTTVADPSRYPVFSRVSGSQVYQSLGITQIKWNHPDANIAGIGTEPLRWKSTAFNVDYQAAKVRFYFDDPDNKMSSFGDTSYIPCDHWLSIGGWYQPYPWNNSGQDAYIGIVQAALAARRWSQPGF